jgi:hypothetical protein
VFIAPRQNRMLFLTGYLRGMPRKLADIMTKRT